MKQLNYRQQDSAQTLHEGLAEYYAHFPDLITADNARPELAELFQHHDIIHVLFGCDTSLHDETLADVWTLLGSTVTLKEYLEYLKYPETTALLRQVGYFKVFWEFFKTIPDIVRVYFKARRMNQKWPWQGYRSYLDQPLHQVRAEFGIQLL